MRMSCPRILITRGYESFHILKSTMLLFMTSPSLLHSTLSVHSVMWVDVMICDLLWCEMIWCDTCAAQPRNRFELSRLHNEAVIVTASRLAAMLISADKMISVFINLLHPLRWNLRTYSVVSSYFSCRAFSKRHDGKANKTGYNVPRWIIWTVRWFTDALYKHLVN